MQNVSQTPVKLGQLGFRGIENFPPSEVISKAISEVYIELTEESLDIVSFPDIQKGKRTLLDHQVTRLA